MHNYSKAYYLKDLRKFPGWKELERPETGALTEESIVYVLDDYTVIINDEHLVKDDYVDEDFLFNDVTPEWKEFCEKELQFAIPDDLKFMYEEEAAEPAAEGSPPPAAEGSPPPAG
jgi:hypothetical protein